MSNINNSNWTDAHNKYLSPPEGEFELDIENVWDEFIVENKPSASIRYILSDYYDKLVKDMMEREDLDKIFNVEIKDGLTLETPSITIGDEVYFCYDTIEEFREKWSNIISKEFLSEGKDLKDNDLVKMAQKEKSDVFNDLSLLPQDVGEVAFRMTDPEIFFSIFDYWWNEKAFEDKNFIIFWE